MTIQHYANGVMILVDWAKHQRAQQDVIFPGKSFAKQVLVVTVIMLITSCSATVKDFNSPVTPAEKFSNSGTIPITDKWWLAFEDPLLNELINQALSQNFNLRATYDRLAQARAIAKIAGADLTPQLNGSFGAARNFVNTNSGRSTIDEFSAGFVASYELDLWGRIRSGMHAAELDEKAAHEDIQVAAITLSAEITSTWYRLIDQRRQSALLDEQIKINRDNVNILITRFNFGQARAADVFQQKQLLQATIGDKTTVLANIKSLEYQLTTLSGKPVNSLTIPEKTEFPILPPKPAAGLSSELIQRRPDIRKAYLKIQAADQRIAAAIADRFPKISLSVSFDSRTPNLHNLFNNWIATLASNMVVPIIDGHRRVAEVERNQAVFSETVNQYGSVILSAVQEVETALIQEQQQLLLVDSLDQQLTLSRQANDQIQLRYRYGGMDFLRVLSARLNLQTLERTRISAERELIDFRINLYKSLAGGWPLQVPDPETPENLIKENI